MTISQTEIDKTYSMPKSYITYRKPRMVSDEQREWARQRMAKIYSREVRFTKLNMQFSI